jgi:hypothetical protein
LHLKHKPGSALLNQASRANFNAGIQLALAAGAADLGSTTAKACRIAVFASLATVLCSGRSAGWLGQHNHSESQGKENEHPKQRSNIVSHFVSPSIAQAMEHCKSLISQNCCSTIHLCYSGYWNKR